MSTTTAEKSPSKLDKYFGISRRGSSVGQEVRGGLVTFFTMAYILALNPLIIGTTADSEGNLVSGLPMLDASGATIEANVGITIGMVAAATALVAGVMTILMGAWGRFPLGLAAGLGLNALLANVIAPMMTWPQAMGLVVWEGILIAILVLTGFRTAVFKAVPKSLRTGITVGIGLFITFVGLINAGIVRKPEAPGTPPVGFGIDGSIIGWPMAVFVVGLLLMVVLHARKVKGALLIAILAATVLAVIIEAISPVGAMSGDNPTGWSLNVPTFAGFSAPDLTLLGRVDMIGGFFPGGEFNITIFIGLLLLVFSLLLADFFDTMGTVVAVGGAGDLLDEDGNPEHVKEILLVDSVAAAAGGLGSVSSNTSFVESASGVGAGARTGLSAIVTGLAFLVGIFLAPLIGMVPSEAASPALVFVGFLMMSNVVDVDWNDIEEGLPTFLTIILMPFAYSITVGIGAGFLAYVFTKTVRGKAREVHPLMWVVAVLFLIYFTQGLITAFLL
nr:NCS2 family permease [Parenemella sanctibonifatiensis]